MISVAPANPNTKSTITKVTLSSTNLLIHGTNNNVPNANFHYAVITSTNIATRPLAESVWGEWQHARRGRVAVRRSVHFRPISNRQEAT